MHPGDTTNKGSYPKPLSDDHIEILEGLLDELETPNHMEAEEMEGFLVAAMAPFGDDAQGLAKAVPLWLGFILGVHDGDERADSDTQIAELIIRHALALQYQLLNDQGLDPLMGVDHEDQVTGVGWAHGYLRGMSLNIDIWQELLDDEEEDEFIEPMLRLTDSEKPPPGEGERDALIDQMLGGAAFAVQWFARQ
jgi:uncharacterized protein